MLNATDWLHVSRSCLHATVDRLGPLSQRVVKSLRTCPEQLLVSVVNEAAFLSHLYSISRAVSGMRFGIFVALHALLAYDTCFILSGLRKVPTWSYERFCVTHQKYFDLQQIATGPPANGGEVINFRSPA